MSERKEYLRKREVELPNLPSGRSQYIELRFNPEFGPVEDCCAGYKIWFGGEYTETVRYDSAHEDFHRHQEGYPEPGLVAEWFTGIDMRRRGSYATQHIKRNSIAWEHVLPIPVEAGKEEPS